MLQPTNLQIFSTFCFAVAILHTFCVKFFEHWAHQFEEKSMGRNVLHFLSEIEVVFGLWSAVFFIGYAFVEGLAVYDQNHQLTSGAFYYIQSLNFVEPLFVTVIMAMAGTRPVILFARKVILTISDKLPLPEKMSFFMTALIIGPLLGSLITEPAAMTVTALILGEGIFSHKASSRLKYATLSLLFVNVSIGGTLTHFAAPPVVMVARHWNWNTAFMLEHFGYKSVLTVFVSTLIYAFIFRKELQDNMDRFEHETEELLKPQWWKAWIHMAFILAAVLSSHYSNMLFAIFAFFLGFTKITEKYQTPVKLRESFLVGFFLSGLIFLGAQQTWWLRPLLQSLSEVGLFLGATALTAITDNAALTYLGSLVDLNEAARYFLVAGAVTGGGLTIIANAPNPIGVGLLREHFKDGISSFEVFKWALLPTLLALLAFGFLPTI